MNSKIERKLEDEIATLKIQMRALQRFYAQQPLNEIQTSAYLKQGQMAQRIPIQGNTYYLDEKGQAILKAISALQFGLGTGIPTNWLGQFLKSLGTTDCENGIKLNVGPTVASGGTFVQDSTAIPVSLNAQTGTLTDNGFLYMVYDATNKLPLAGFGFASCSPNGVGGAGEQALFRFDDGGITLISNSANVVTTNTDVKLCLLHTAYSAGTNSTYLRIRNCLGYTGTVGFFIVYWRC